MNYWIASIFTTIIVVGVLAWVVYSRNKFRPLNRRFPIFALNLILWSISVILVMASNNIVYSVFFIKVASIFGAFLPSSFIFFASGFEVPSDGKEPEQLKKMQLLFFISALIASLCVLHPEFIEKVIVREKILNNLPGPDVVYGWPFFVFSGIIIFSMFFGLRYLYRLMRKKTGAEKVEIQYIFFSIFAGTIFAIGTVIIPPLFGNTTYSRFGPFSSIIMCSIIAYAIARYKIMNISVVVEKMFVFGSLTTALIVIYLFLLLFLNNFVRVFSSSGSMIPVIISSFIIAVSFSPLKEFITNLARTKIFHQQYNLDKITLQMRFLTDRFSNLEEGISAMIEVLQKEIDLEKEPVFIINTDDVSIKRAFSILQRSKQWQVEFKKECPILKLLESEPCIHYKDELLRFASKPLMGNAISEMNAYDSSVIIPLVVRNKLMGGVLLGGKQGGLSFLELDKKILDTFSIYIGIFIETMQLTTNLKESQMYQHFLLENLPSGVIAVNNQGSVIVFNQAAEKISGIKKKDVIGGNFETVIPESFRGLFAELLKQNIEINNKDLILSKNGNAIPLRISGSRFYSIDGSLLGAQVIFSDISQLKMLQYQAERNERLASLGILAGGIAHEIRNPLVALKTFSQLLPERFADDKFRSDYLKVVIPEIDRINHLIEQLLVFAKPRPPRMEEFDLISVIESTILLVSNQEKFRNINIQTNFNSKGIKIRADSEKIKQALLNLLFNAAEAIDKKGGVINISVSENEGKSIIEIMDNGSGISSENINKIFDPLFTTKPYGTGLGLSIVNEIIAQHNGRIYIESQDGQGTRVIIYLPLNTGVFQ